jgi:hypothetical protein
MGHYIIFTMISATCLGPHIRKVAGYVPLSDFSWSFFFNDLASRIGCKAEMTRLYILGAGREDRRPSCALVYMF